MKFAKLDIAYRKEQGSLTVEAAFVLPIFIYAIAIFLYFFQIIYTQNKVQIALNQTASFYAKNALLFEGLNDEFSLSDDNTLSQISDAFGIDTLICSGVYTNTFRGYLEEEISKCVVVVGGSYGITIQPQTDMFEEDQIDLCAYYQCRIPILFFHVEPMECIQRVRMRPWTGMKATKQYEEKQEDGENEDSETTVYMTETGDKYHTHLDCTHLKLSIREVSFQEIKYLRNRSNEKYSSCQSCGKNVSFINSSIVFITDEGNRYHTSKQCSGLKRTIQKIDCRNVPSSVTLCKRCEKRDQVNE